MQIKTSTLTQQYQLAIEDITFASTEIGHATAGRSATTVWSATDDVIFRGELKSVLIFALMAFDLDGLNVLEKFTLIPTKEIVDVSNLTISDIPGVVELDPVGLEGIVTAEDVTFLDNLITGQGKWNAVFDFILQDKATGLVNQQYYGEVLQILCAFLRFDEVTPGSEVPLYTLENISMSSRRSTKVGTTWNAIDDPILGMATYIAAARAMAIRILQA